MAKIVIRKATSLDVVNVFEFLGAATDPPNIRLGRPTMDAFMAFLLDTIQRGYVAVATIDGLVIGVAGVAVTRPPWTSDAVMNLEVFYVDPEYRAGVPAALLRNLMKEMDKYDLRVRMHIAYSDAQAIGAESLIALGLRQAGGVYITTQDDAKQETQNDRLHDSGGAEERDDLVRELDNDRQVGDDSRPAVEDDADGAAEPDADEPWATAED